MLFASHRIAGITKATHGDRPARLIAFKNKMLEEAKAARRMYPGRVKLVEIDSLSAWDEKLMASLNGSAGYSGSEGRNAS